ncbi:MAG: hypothetical protein JXB62_22515 [Pirellulales bacterium]|nr:hypothetical protein [Pirellulales bacterium]
MAESWPPGEAADAGTLVGDPAPTAADAGQGDKLPDSIRVQAIALDHSVSLSWPRPAGSFDHYAVYRATRPFTAVSAMSPIATLDGPLVSEFSDMTAENGVPYYYAVTAVAADGSEQTQVETAGPRTPRDETDLQIVSISRSPQCPRYAADYTSYEITEPSGFGPYHTAASTRLNNGQTFQTQRFPDMGDPVTYTATVRNRGTNTYCGTLAGAWHLDGAIVGTPSQVIELAPGEVATFARVIAWDGQPHELSFSMDAGDARPGNDQLTSDTLAVPFLTYVDASFIETFREVWSPLYPEAATDDMLDWLNRQMTRFNELFEEAGCAKRVHYDVLQVVDDYRADPPIDRSPYAVFPLRYRFGTERDPRQTGFYHQEEDIDYGLPHEMAHQLGVIDLYRLNLSPDNNLVSGIGYAAADGLMRTGAPFLSEHTALAMDHWLNEAHGYYGQYLYCIPETIQLRVLDCHGQPLPGATVEVFQMCDWVGDDRGSVITRRAKAQGVTDGEGLFTLPNVPIDSALFPPVGTGDQLRDNPFGYVDCVGSNAVLHFRVEYDGAVDYAWLDITEANVAYWQGETDTAVFERQVGLGGPVQYRPPQDMAEQSARDWSAWSEDGSCSIDDDAERKCVGESSVRFVTDGGFDNAIRYPRTFNAQWDLSRASHMRISVYAENTESFQHGSPWIRLCDANGNYFQYQYFRNGVNADLLNEARGTWQSYRIPLDAPADTQTGWRRTGHGSPDLGDVRFVEIHADTWGYGFTLWVDGVGFDFSDSRVVGRQVFYNNSAFDGYDPGAGVADDAAIATDKVALRPGQSATFAHYTSYSRGINGLMLDVDGLPSGAGLGTDDFQFLAGNSDDVSHWTSVASPTSITVRRRAGIGGSDRVTILWPDGAIANQWLQVTVRCTEATGLAEADVFYFGNALGEAGNSTTVARVNAVDMLLARNNPRTLLDPAPIDFPYDYNRDARVNATDMLLARANQTHFLNALHLFRREPAVMITEVGTAAEDYVEIQNLGASEMDTSGWIVVVNDAYDVGHAADIHACHSARWLLPEILAPNVPLYRTDIDDGTGHYWGDSIFWRTLGPGWVVILDDHQTVVDFVVWGYDTEAIESLTLTVDGTLIDAGAAWDGPAVFPGGGLEISLQRIGESDDDDASNWEVFTWSPGEQNTELHTPFFTGGAPRSP